MIFSLSFSDYLPEYSIFVRFQEKYFIRNAAFRII